MTRRLGLFRIFLFLLIAPAIVGQPSRAQDQLQLSVASENVIDQLAKHAEQAQKVMAGLLERYGFSPTGWTGQDWRVEQLCAYEQLEFDYQRRSASPEAATRQAGGVHF